MNSKVKKFIEDNIELIEDNQWEELYKKTIRDLIWDTGKFTETILKANINPLDCLDYIPDYYLIECKISREFIIPKDIKKIGAGAFSSCDSLTNIVIPNNVTIIGNYAFSNCSSLVSVTIDDGVMSIERGAFYYCSGLTSVTISDSVTEIGDYAFRNCDSLTNITYKGTKELWENIKKGAYWHDSTPLKVIHCKDGYIHI